jgi:hypothetical protein
MPFLVPCDSVTSNSESLFCLNVTENQLTLLRFMTSYMTYIHIVIFWVITLCSVVYVYRRFGGTHYLLQSIGTHLPVYALSNPRTKWSWFSPPWEPEISRSVGYSSTHFRVFLPAPIDGKIMILIKATKQRWQHIITGERPELRLHCALPARHERDRRATNVTLFVSIFAPRIVISG